jgi:hypothetical protein
MLNPKETLKSIKALLTSEEAPEATVKDVVLEEAPQEEAPKEEESPKEEFVSIAVFEEAISMIVAEIEALKGGEPEEAPKEEEMSKDVKEKEELSAEVVAEEKTELHVHNPEVQQINKKSNRAKNTKESVWNIINNK